MAEPQHCDAIIIGAGQGGGPLASALAGAGSKVAIVERRYVGGTCINDGCTPTKTMVASARAAYIARRGADYGVRTAGAITMDMERVRQRKRDIVESFRSGSQKRLEGADGVDLLFGEAAFTGPKTVRVRLNDGGEVALRGERIFVNTGSRPVVPPVDGISEVPALDNTSIMELDTVPEHLLVLGGGYVGLEFAQMFRRFGSRVTIIQRDPQLLPREDQDIADEVAGILREDGIEVLLNANAKRVTGNIEMDVATADGVRRLSGSHLLVATGRRPNTDALESAGPRNRDWTRAALSRLTIDWRPAPKASTPSAT